MFLQGSERLFRRADGKPWVWWLYGGTSTRTCGRADPLTLSSAGEALPVFEGHEPHTRSKNRVSSSMSAPSPPGLAASGPPQSRATGINPLCRYLWIKLNMAGRESGTASSSLLSCTTPSGQRSTACFSRLTPSCCPLCSPVSCLQMRVTWSHRAAAQPSFPSRWWVHLRTQCPMGKDPCTAVPACRRDTTQSFPHIRDRASSSLRLARRIKG